MNIKKGLAIVLSSVMIVSPIMSVYAYDTNDEKEVVELPAVSDNDISEDEVVQTHEIPKVKAASGTCGENVTWTLDSEGTLTISGTGYIANYSSSSSPWYSKRSIIKEVIIENGVTSIGSNAFENCYSLTSITISDSVTSIRNDAFKYCESLMSITIPDSVTSIGDRAFAWSDNLAFVTIGNGVISIGVSAFEGCYNLESATIPDSVESIGNWAFADCSSLTSVTIPDSVTSIGNGAFYGCSAFALVTIPDSVTSIGNGAFYGCSFALVTIPGRITSIGESTFEMCTNLTSVTISENVTSIGERAFAYCSSLTDVYYSGSELDWEKISIASNNDPLINAYIHFEKEECEHDYGEWEITTAPGCATDGEKQKVCSLCGDVVTESVSSKWHNMKENVVAPTCTDEGYTHHYCENCSYAYNDTYIDAAGHSFGDWKKNDSEEYERECSVCGHKEFCSALIVASGVFGEKLTWILDSNGILTISGMGNMTNNISSFDAPWYNYRLMIKNVVIEDGVISIGDYAFFDCSSLVSVTIPNSVTSIGKGAFEFCESLATILIPDGVTNIGDLAFYCCSKLSSITVSENNEYYSSDEFGVLFNKDKTELIQYPVGNEMKTYAIPETVVDIGDYAFCKGLNLTSVTISESVKNIGDFAFSGCENLISVIISESVESISIGAFNNCASLDNVYYYGDGEEWKNISVDAGNDPLLNAKNIVFGYPDSMAVAIKVATLPKTVYSYGEELSLDGMSVDAVYHDGSVVNTTDYAVIGYDKYAFGYQTLTVVSGDLTCELNVCVKPNEPNALTTPLEAGVTVAEFAEPYSALYSVYVFDNDKMTQLEDDDIIKTGCVVQFVRNKSVVDSVAIVVKGDATGDGVINGKDIIRIKKQILEGGAVEYIEYADVNCDGVVDEYDLDVLVCMI